MFCVFGRGMSRVRIILDELCRVPGPLHRVQQLRFFESDVMPNGCMVSRKIDYRRFDTSLLDQRVFDAPNTGGTRHALDRYRCFYDLLLIVDMSRLTVIHCCLT